MTPSSASKAAIEQVVLALDQEAGLGRLLDQLAPVVGSVF